MSRVFVSAVVAVLVVASACGGGDQDGTRVEPPTDAREEPPPDARAEPPADATAIDTAADSTTVEALDQRERVQLGSRFEWCATTQSAWDRNDEGFRAALDAVADYNDALGALSGAVDELDRAEALEQIDALQRRAEDLIAAYDDVVMRGMIGQLNAGAEGTEGVAYSRALDAFIASASEEDLTLLREFHAIDRSSYWNRDAASVLALPLPSAVRASLGVRAAEEARELLERELAEPLSTPTVSDARDAVRSGLEESGYEYRVVLAAGGVAHAAVLGNLGDVDLVSAARAYAEAVVDYQATIRLAFESAMAASETAAANAAARRVFDEAVAASDAAYLAYNEAENAAYPEALAEGLLDEAYEAREDAWKEAGYAVSDAVQMVWSEARRAAEAAQDAARAAADDALATDARQVVAETVRAARAEGLEAAVVAEAALNQFEQGLIEVHRYRGLGPRTFLDFLEQAIAVESLVRSDPWHAMQRSLADACQ